MDGHGKARPAAVEEDSKPVHYRVAVELMVSFVLRVFLIPIPRPRLCCNTLPTDEARICCGAAVVSHTSVALVVQHDCCPRNYGYGGCSRVGSEYGMCVCVWGGGGQDARPVIDRGHVEKTPPMTCGIQSARISNIRSKPISEVLNPRRDKSSRLKTTTGVQSSYSTLSTRRGNVLHYRTALRYGTCTRTGNGLRPQATPVPLYEYLYEASFSASCRPQFLY